MFNIRPFLPSRYFQRLSILGVLILGTTFSGMMASAQTPGTPVATGLTLSALSTDQYGFLVRWNDVLNDTRYDIFANTINDSATATFVQQVGQDSTFASVELANSYFPVSTAAYFWVRAYNETSGLVSAMSNPVGVVIPGAASYVFNAPTGLAASFPAADKVRLSWTDQSNMEDRVEIEARDTSIVGSAFQLVVQVGYSLNQIDISNYFATGKTYEVRMRARRWTGIFRSSTPAYTSYSSVLTVAVPGSVIAGTTPPTIGAITSSKLSNDYYGYKVNWTDNSSDETGFEVWATDSFGGTERTLMADVGAGSTYANVYVNTYLNPAGSIIYFDVRAYTGSTTKVYSGWSGVASLTVPSTNVWNAPGSFAVNLVSGSPRLTWTDNSELEDVFQVEGRDMSVVGSTFQSVVDIPFNLTQADLPTYFQSGKTYELRLRARRWNSDYGVTANYTAYTLTVTLVMPGTVSGPPASPQNLAVAAYPSGSYYVFGLSWDDKSTDETGFEIQEKGSLENTWRTLQVVAGDTPGTPNGVGVGYAGHYNSSGDVVYFAANDAFDFQVRAVKGDGPFQQVSTSFVTVLNTKQASFDPPSNLRLTAPADNGLIQLFWSDNSTTEEGVEIEASTAGGGYQVLGTLGQTDFSRYQSGGGVGTFPPSTQIQFRLRAYKGGASRVYTSYSNVASVTMPDMTAPSNLQQGGAASEGTVNLTWADNSQNDAGYAVEARKTLPAPADSAFGQALLFTAASATSASLTTQHVIPGYTYEFRVRAANQVDGSSPIIYSSASNTLTVTVPFNAPTNLHVQSGTLTETSVQLAWNDNSSMEQGYNIYSRPGGSASAPTLVGQVAAGTTVSTVKLTSGTSREFFVEAYLLLNPSGESHSAMTPGLTVTAPDAMTSAVYIELHKDEVMPPYTITTTTGSSVVTRSMTGLPAGLSFNSSTGELSGTPTGTGVTQCPVQITFASGWTHNNTLAIRILQAPVANVFPTQKLVAGTPVTVPLLDKFTDPDASSAVRVNTNLATNGGNMDFILFDTATPLHVANFMGYVSRGDYADTVFHRSIGGFISQAGAYRPGVTAAAFTAVTTQAPVTNEPGISNIRGTVALAKLDGQPSSGTNQFFVNLANNGPNLDFQNSGFTAFARVTAPGMSVVDSLAALPTGTYNVTVGGSAISFADFPFNAATAPVSMDNTQAVKINSVTVLPVLGYSIVSNSNATIVTASIASGSLSLTPLAIGTSNVVVRATDLEGHSVDTTVSVRVENSFATWAATQSLPGGQDGPTDDADGDGDTNLEEFGFLTSPTIAREHTSLAPVPQTSGSDHYASITFKVRKLARLIYSVEASSDLADSGWSTIWTVSNGFTAANVVSAVDNPDHVRVTIKDSEILSPVVPRFLRVKIAEPPPPPP